MMVTAMMTVPMFDSETATREVAENTEARMGIGDPVTGTDADGDIARSTPWAVQTRPASTSTRKRAS